jgi:hypothetical protein
MMTLKRPLLLAIGLLLMASLTSCVVEETRPCPPGSHPGPYGHRCFAD